MREHPLDTTSNVILHGHVIASHFFHFIFVQNKDIELGNLFFILLDDVQWIHFGADGLVVRIPIRCLALGPAVGRRLAPAALAQQTRLGEPLAVPAVGHETDHFNPTRRVLVHRSNDAQLVHLEVRQPARQSLKKEKNPSKFVNQ